MNDGPLNRSAVAADRLSTLGQYAAKPMTVSQ